MVDIETGKAIYKAQVDGAVPSEPAAVDTDQNGFLDTIYVGTPAGFLYKVDIVRRRPTSMAATGQDRRRRRSGRRSRSSTPRRPRHLLPADGDLRRELGPLRARRSAPVTARICGPRPRRQPGRPLLPDPRQRLRRRAWAPISTGPLHEADFEQIPVDADAVDRQLPGRSGGTNRPGWVLELGATSGW